MSDESRSIVNYRPLKPVDKLFEAGWEFDFFQAVWLLERMTEDAVPVGMRGPVQRERLRFRPHHMLGFPSTDIRAIEKVRSDVSPDPIYRLEVTFLGLYGVSTPLPVHYAVDVLRGIEQAALDDAAETGAAEAMQPEQPARRHGGDVIVDPAEGSTAVRDFVDLLHHRMLSMFYRSWTKYRYERLFVLPQRDDITRYLSLLIGLPQDCRREELGVDPTRMIRYAGLLTQHPRSAVSLEGLLSDYWRTLPVRVFQFVGRWVALSDGNLNAIGRRNSRLGVDLTVGEQVYDLSGAIRVDFGPLDWATYLTFLPDQERFLETRSLIQLYCQDPLAGFIELRIKAGEIPPMQLGSEGGVRLGYTSWVTSGEMGETSVRFDATTRTIRFPLTAGAPAA